MRKLHFYSKAAIGLIVLMCSQFAFSACSRSDIDHYLAEGFTPSQITNICATEKINVINLEPITKKYLASDKKLEKEEVLFLQSAIAAVEVKFLDNRFYYESRECIEYDPKPARIEIRPKKFCGYIRTTVNYKDLNIPSPEGFNLSFFGNPSVVVQGFIHREVMEAKKLNILTKFEKNLLMKKLGDVKKADIPVRQGILLDKFKLELKKLAS